MGEKYQENLDQLEAISEKLKEISGLLSNLSKNQQLDFAANFVSILEPIAKVSISLSRLNSRFDGVWDQLSGTKQQFKNYGKYIGEGIVSGLKESTKKISDATEDIAKEISFTFSSTLVINSPSRVMKKLASYIPDGVVEGIQDGLRDVKKSMSKLTDAVEEPAKGLSKFKFSLGGLSAIAGGVGLAIGAFSSFMASNDELRAKMEEAFAKIKEAFAPVLEAVMGLFDAFTAGGEGSCSMMDTIASVAGALAQTLAGVIEAVSGFFKEHGDSIMAVVSTIGAFVSEIAGAMVSVLGGVFDLIVGIFTGNGDKIKEGFADIWSGIKKVFSGFGDFFSGLWDKIVGVFGKIGTRVGDAIGGAFKTVVNTIIGFAEKTINGFIKAINGAIGLINAIPGVEISKLKLLSIPKLASGGIVTPGQFFVARESGPELVGNFGVNTAVMNNNQIVDAVSAGVYKAVKEAMGSGGGTYTFNINNHLDGREVGRQVIKYHNGVVKQTGSSPLLI